MKIDGEPKLALHFSGDAWHGKLFGWSEKLFEESYSFNEYFFYEWKNCKTFFCFTKLRILLDGDKIENFTSTSTRVTGFDEDLMCTVYI